VQRTMGAPFPLGLLNLPFDPSLPRSLGLSISQPGNKRLRDFAEPWKPYYKNLRNTEKARFAKSILDEWRIDTNPQGRVLRRAKGDVLRELADEDAVMIVMGILRRDAKSARAQANDEALPPTPLTVSAREMEPTHATASRALDDAVTPPCPAPFLPSRPLPDDFVQPTQSNRPCALSMAFNLPIKLSGEEGPTQPDHESFGDVSYGTLPDLMSCGSLVHEEELLIGAAHHMEAVPPVGFVPIPASFAVNPAGGPVPTHVTVPNTVTPPRPTPPQLQQAVATRPNAPSNHQSPPPTGLGAAGNPAYMSSSRRSSPRRSLSRQPLPPAPPLAASPTSSTADGTETTFEAADACAASPRSGARSLGAADAGSSKHPAKTFFGRRTLPSLASRVKAWLNRLGCGSRRGEELD
jgi:hypothetical protein